MCITEVTSYKVGDKLFENEDEAINFKLDLIGQKIMKNYSHDAAQGILDNREEIMYILNRIEAKQHPAEILQKKASDSPRGDPLAFHAPNCRLRATTGGKCNCHIAGED